MQEAAHAHELVQWDAQIRARNDELTRLTSENTRCLTAVAEYTRNQMDMEDTLANTQVRCSPDLMPCKCSEALVLWTHHCHVSCLLIMVMTWTPNSFTAMKRFADAAIVLVCLGRLATCAALKSMQG